MVSKRFFSVVMLLVVAGSFSVVVADEVTNDAPNTTWVGSVKTFVSDNSSNYYSNVTGHYVPATAGFVVGGVAANKLSKVAGFGKAVRYTLNSVGALTGAGLAASFAQDGWKKWTVVTAAVAAAGYKLYKVATK